MADNDCLLSFNEKKVNKLKLMHFPERVIDFLVFDCICARPGEGNWVWKWKPSTPVIVHVYVNENHKLRLYQPNPLNIIRTCPNPKASKVAIRVK